MVFEYPCPQIEELECTSWGEPGFHVESNKVGGPCELRIVPGGGRVCCCSVENIQIKHLGPNW